MKKYLFYSLIAIAILMSTSCDKDSDLSSDYCGLIEVTTKFTTPSGDECFKTVKGWDKNCNGVLNLEEVIPSFTEIECLNPKARK